MMWSARLLRCGSFRLDAGCMFGLIPRIVWTRWFQAGVIDDANRMPLQTNSLLLESGGRLVVVEVGIGDKMSAKEHQMYAQEMTAGGGPRCVHHALEEVGCRAEDVSAVITTHLHFDHAGGLTRRGAGERPALTFPNATLYTQEQEWADAVAGRSTMNKTYLPNHLTAEVRERTRQVPGEQEILPGITVFPVPGHTWGQQVIKVETLRGPVVFCNDVMPTALHGRPTTNLAYDVEPYTSMIERQKLLERAHRDGWRLVLDHEPGHPVFRVEREVEAFRLEAAELS